MKAILYFTAVGLLRTEDKTAATAIASATEEKVVFRNKHAAESSGEKPEANEGVAGLVPSTYFGQGFTFYDDKGKKVAEEDFANQAKAPKKEGKAPGTKTGGEKLNKIGLRKGEPETLKKLKEALDSEGIEYHPSSPVEELVTAYNKHFHPESVETEETE